MRRNFSTKRVISEQTGLCCLECGGALRRDNGYFTCWLCPAKYLVSNRVPRFVEQDSYARSFSIEWARHSRTQLDSATGLYRAERMFFERTGLTPGELKGKTVLDVGCGIGRFLEVVVKYGGIVTGVDLSLSVDFAKQNVPAARVIQADLMNLPFRGETFDIVFAIGVLHHTPNTREAFNSLIRLVKPGGKIAIWVYSNEGLTKKFTNATSGAFRIITTRMPRSMLSRLCYVSLPLYYVNKIPVVGMVTKGLFLISNEPDPEWRVLDTFDWYSPKYQHKHSYREVHSWFENVGLTEIRDLPVAVSVSGVKKL